MEPTDLTLEVLQGIQSTLVDMRDELRGVRGDLGALQRHASTTNDRLASLELHTVATRESIDLLRTQAVMAGQALTAQMEGRLGLDERVDGLERRVEALESER